MGKGVYAFRCTNFTPEMIEFMDNQSNLQGSIARMIEDTVSRFGTGDLLKTSTMRMYTKDQQGEMECANDQLVALLKKALIDATTTLPNPVVQNEKSTIHPKEAGKSMVEKTEKANENDHDMTFDATLDPDLPSINGESEIPERDAQDDNESIVDDNNANDNEDIILEYDSPEDTTDNFDRSIWDD